MNIRPLLTTISLLIIPASALADAVTDWNATHLQAIRQAGTNPPRASRQMAMLGVAVYDALNGISRTYWPYHVTALAPAGASKDAAVSAAAKAILDSVYNGNATALATIDTRYTTSLAAIPDSQSKTDGLAWGTSVGNAILTLRANDGSGTVLPYTPGTNPGEWRPTPPANAAALLPNWGNVTTFGMVNSASFRPQPPPRLETAAWATEFNQVKELGSATSATRTANETEIARFWADGGGTETPPGHWMRIAAEVGLARGQSIEANARMLALLGMCVADAGIACWEAKYQFNLWRPITAIREADTDGNPATAQDAAWTPLIGTPPFPEYTSGHSTFSRSSANVLAKFFGTDAIPFATTSDGLAGVTRNYSGFSAAADEAGMSRVYGGIHYNCACATGQMCGELIANFIWGNYLRPLSALQFTVVNKAGTDLELDLAVTAGKTYRIDASSDFLDWEEIAVITAGSPSIHITDTNAPAGKRFYRATEL